jgi:hypothetical protein
LILVLSFWVGVAGPPRTETVGSAAVTPSRHCTDFGTISVLF